MENVISDYYQIMFYNVIPHPLFFVVSEWIENVLNYPVVTRELFGAMGPMVLFKRFRKPHRESIEILRK